MSAVIVCFLQDTNFDVLRINSITFNFYTVLFVFYFRMNFGFLSFTSIAFNFHTVLFIFYFYAKLFSSHLQKRIKERPLPQPAQWSEWSRTGPTSRRTKYLASVTANFGWDYLFIYFAYFFDLWENPNLFIVQFLLVFWLLQFYFNLFDCCIDSEIFRFINWTIISWFGSLKYSSELSLHVSNTKTFSVVLLAFVVFWICYLPFWITMPIKIFFIFDLDFTSEV